MGRVKKSTSAAVSEHDTRKNADKVVHSSSDYLINLKVLRMAFEARGMRAFFLIFAGLISFLYTLLLPFEFTQSISLANWHYLTPYLFGWSVFIGFSMALVIVLQIYAVRVIGSSRSGALGGLAFIGSILSSFLCCTPIIPTLLAFVGMSAVSVYATTGALQHFFATNQTGLLSGSAVLLAFAIWWALRSIAHADCLSGDVCINGRTSITEGRNQSINMTFTKTKGVDG